MKEKLEQIIIQLDSQDWHGYGTETLWAEEIDKNIFRLKNVPYYAKGVSVEDTILVEQRKGNNYFKFVKERGGHSTYRIIINEDITIEKFREYWEELENIGCTYEKGKGCLFAVDVPPNTNIYDTYKLLEKGETEGVWDFEEGHCGHSLNS